MQPRVRLVHWNAAEAWPRVEQLGAAGYAVDYDADSDDLLRGVRAAAPVAFVIDLGRLPSHGTEIALAFRLRKATRDIPLVFVGGEADKIAKVRAVLPDAAYTTWGRIRSVLARVIAHPPEKPVVPGSVLAAYAGTPLVRKLGIKPGFDVVLVDAPAGFERTLGSLPDGAAVRHRNTGSRDLTIWFVTSAEALHRGIGWMRVAIGAGGLWIVWPKQTSAHAGDLTQADVRRSGLEAGLVDYKVCAIDATWSGLKFSRRKI